MKETYQYLASGCDHPLLKASSRCEAVSEACTPLSWRRKTQPRKSSTVGEDTAILLNWLG
jgi:hypothetical protein